MAAKPSVSATPEFMTSPTAAALLVDALTRLADAAGGEGTSPVDQILGRSYRRWAREVAAVHAEGEAA